MRVPPSHFIRVVAHEGINNPLVKALESAIADEAVSQDVPSSQNPPF